MTVPKESPKLSCLFFFIKDERFWIAPPVDYEQDQKYIAVDHELFRCLFPDIGKLPRIYVRDAYKDIDRLIESLCNAAVDS